MIFPPSPNHPNHPLLERKKMKKVLTLIMLFIIIIVNLPIYSLAEDNLKINTDKENINLNENFKIYVNIGNIDVASYTLNIYFDNTKVEYISGSDNTNVINNRIINIWYDETGGKNTKNNQEIAVFEFKAKETGTASFYLGGELFDNNANKIQVNNSYTNINISEESKNTRTSENIKQTNNSMLKIMRLDKEGIIPEFSPDIKEYYFTTDLSTNSLNITAIPEAENSKVSIIGNENLKEGLNKILIEVTSNDNTSKSVYVINVTKTNNKDTANANLETLAIENVDLEPIFDTNILNYKVSVANDVKSINVFAVPEKIEGKVEISGNTEIKEGDNNVTIKVIAPNGYTYKNYIINVHRRTKEEDVKLEEEQKANKEQLNEILEEKGIEFLSTEQEIENNVENKNYEKDNKRAIIIGFVIVIVVGMFIIYKMKNKNKKLQ